MSFKCFQWWVSFLISITFSYYLASANILGALDSCRMAPTFCTIVDFVLNGSVYNTTFTKTHMGCLYACEAEPNCHSTNFMYAATMNAHHECQLNSRCHDGGSVESIGKPGWVYTSRKVQKCPGRDLKLEVPTECLSGHPFATAFSHPSHADASDECQQKGQHLCELWELESGNIATLPQHVSMWYAVPDSQVVLSGSVVTYHGLPVTAPSSGVCCFGAFVGSQDPFAPSTLHKVDDRDGMKSTCAGLGAHLCTLPELKAAYMRGYRHQYLWMGWLYFAIPNYDARLYDDGCSSYPDNECYEGIVAFTPRPHAESHVYCCPNLYIVPNS